MRLKLLYVATILLLAGSSDGRPQQLEVSASLQPKVEDDNTEGWRPVHHDAKFEQESIPVGKDLPQIVEGNSRYTEDERARRRKSYVKNNPFYEDHIPIFGNGNTRNRSNEQLDLETFKPEVFKRSNPLEDVRQRGNDELVTGDRNSSDVKILPNYIGKNKIQGTSIETIDSRNNSKILSKPANDGQKFKFMVDKVSTDLESNSNSSMTENLNNTAPVLVDHDFSSTDKNTNPATSLRNEISSRYMGEMKVKPLLLQNVSNVDSLLSSNPNKDKSVLEPRISENESQTRMVDFTKVRPQIILHSRTISDGYEPIHVSKEKAINYVEIIPVHSNAKKFTNKTTFLQSNLHNLHNIHNQVLGMGSNNSKTKVQQSGGNSNNIVVGFQRLANQTSKHRIGSKNSTKNQIRIKPQATEPPFDLIIKHEGHEANDQEYSKNSVKNSLGLKPNSSQSIPELKLKNWPNGNLQNIEDLFNYEKYTSSHNGDDNLKAQEVADDSVAHHNSVNVHKVIKKADKEKGPKPSVLSFDHSSKPTQSVQNSEADAATIYDPEPYVNLEQSGQEVVQWQQIHPFTTNNTDFLITDINEAESNAFDLIPEGLQPNRPLNPDHHQTQNTNYYGYVDESLPGSNPPVQIVHDHDENLVQGQGYYQNEYDQPISEYPNLENNFDPAGGTRPTSETNESDETYNVYQNGPVYTPDLSKQPNFNPLSVVSQNTIVHILNAGKKRPNVTVTEMKVTPNHSHASLKPEDHSVHNENSSSASTPNVHIMFTTEEDKDEGNGPQYELMADPNIPIVTYDDNINCPTIKINSYTRINNTIQGKEGCTDLNIIINSHVLNTNVFNPASTSGENHGAENKIPSERYPGNDQAEPIYANSDGGFVSSGGSYGTIPTGSGQNTGELVPNDFQDFPIIEGQNPQANPQGGQFDQQFPGTSIFEVFQQTQINVGSQNDISSTGDALDPSVPNGISNPGDGLDDVPTPPEDGIPNVPSSPDAIPETGVLNDPVSLTEVMDDPGIPEFSGEPVSGGGIPSSPQLGGIQGPLADDGAGGVAADDLLSPASVGPSGIQFPSIGNPLSGITSQLPNFPGNVGSQNGSGGSGTNSGISSPGSMLGNNGDDDDDYYDDDLIDLMSFSIIESVSSVLPYITLLSPLSYGFLSLAISPVAVAVAGLFGLAAAFIPYAFSRAFGFGRANNRVVIRLRPSFEEVVKRSIEQYENWNEWKSKRKKRKR